VFNPSFLILPAAVAAGRKKILGFWLPVSIDIIIIFIKQLIFRMGVMMLKKTSCETENHPFGIDIEFIKECDAKKFEAMQSRFRVCNSPVREDGEDFWEFINKPVPEDKSIFTSDVIDALRGV
jgi:hypothetical protein